MTSQSIHNWNLGTISYFSALTVMLCCLPGDDRLQLTRGYPYLLLAITDFTCSLNCFDLLK